MKKTILTVALCFYANLAHAETNYPHPEQFKEYNVKGTSIYIIKDTITGCEYMTRNSNDAFVLREGSCNKSVKKE